MLRWFSCKYHIDGGALFLPVRKLEVNLQFQNAEYFLHFLIDKQIEGLRLDEPRFNICLFECSNSVE